MTEVATYPPLPQAPNDASAPQAGKGVNERRSGFVAEIDEVTPEPSSSVPQTSLPKIDRTAKLINKGKEKLTEPDASSKEVDEDSRDERCYVYEDANGKKHEGLTLEEYCELAGEKSDDEDDDPEDALDAEKRREYLSDGIKARQPATPPPGEIMKMWQECFPIVQRWWLNIVTERDNKKINDVQEKIKKYNQDNNRLEYMDLLPADEWQAQIITIKKALETPSNSDKLAEHVGIWIQKLEEVGVNPRQIAAPWFYDKIQLPGTAAKLEEVRGRLFAPSNPQYSVIKKYKTPVEKLLFDEKLKTKYQMLKLIDSLNNELCTVNETQGLAAMDHVLEVEHLRDYVAAWKAKDEAKCASLVRLVAALFRTEYNMPLRGQETAVLTATEADHYSRRLIRNAKPVVADEEMGEAPASRSSTDDPSNATPNNATSAASQDEPEVTTAFTPINGSQRNAAATPRQNAKENAQGTASKHVLVQDNGISKPIWGCRQTKRYGNELLLPVNPTDKDCAVFDMVSADTFEDGIVDSYKRAMAAQGASTSLEEGSRDALNKSHWQDWFGPGNGIKWMAVERRDTLPPKNGYKNRPRTLLGFQSNGESICHFRSYVGAKFGVKKVDSYIEEFENRSGVPGYSIQGTSKAVALQASTPDRLHQSNVNVPVDRNIQDNLNGKDNRRSPGNLMGMEARFEQKMQEGLERTESKLEASMKAQFEQMMAHLNARLPKN